MDNSTIHVKGITKRWLINVLSVIVTVVLLAILTFGILIRDYYYNSISQDMESRISTSSGFFTRYVTSDMGEFEIGAKEFVDDFLDKNVVEVQVFDRNDNMIAASRGFWSDKQELQDYYLAKKSDDGMGKWTGKNANGESVMAVTSLLPQINGISIGAIRFVVSMDAANRQIFVNIMLIVAVGLFLILFAFISGWYFLRSIIRPVRAITDVAYRIASGNFSDRLAVQDNDEIGKLCDTINYMATELESTENLKNEFISSVSHELRTPLTVIKGWGETVKLSARTDPEMVEKGMSVIIGEAERLSGLVEDLLDFSRMQSGRLTLHMQKVDLLAELGEAVYLYRETAKQSGVKIVYVEPESLPPVMADPNRLKQVFINILDNAVKYSSDGGEVLVEATQHDVYLQVTISDTGCGIAPEDLGKVKEKFYKANKTVRGSGIGLAIADEIMKQHDGILEIDSKEGAGTTESIVLPFIKTEKEKKD